jgi:hypothetical protein
LIGLGALANRGGKNRKPDPMNEADSKRLRHHTPVLPAKQDVAAEKADEATALGESEAGYSAAQRLLDEAVEAAVRPLPVWGARHPQPVVQKIEYELKLPSGESLHLSESYGTTWYAGLAVGSHVKAESLDAAKPEAVALVIDRLERTLAELRFYQQHLTRKPSNGQPSVTAATSAALVEQYTEDSTEAAR